MTTPTTSFERGPARHLPLAFVILALIVLVALPIVSERYARPFRLELREVVEPSRALVTRVHVALAIEGSAFHDFLEVGDSTLLRRYERAYADETQAYADLQPFTGRLGPAVQQRFAEVRELERQWHGMVTQILRDRQLGRVRAVRRAATTEEDAFERLLLAVAELDAALAAAAQQRRRTVTEAEQIQRRFTVVLGLVALGAVFGVAWLGQRVRLYARAAQERQAELEAAMESRARLMRGVSHDLKNPLGTIDGHATLLAEGIKGPLNDAQQASLRRIRRSVRSLLGLITDLLELSKAEAGVLSVRSRPTNLGDVVRDAADEHRAAANATGHELLTDIADELPTVYTDPDRVRQVLGNLLSNAVKHTPGGGQILVRVAERPPDGRVAADACVAIDVADTGPGIPADKLDEIFEEFSRLHPDATTGAGLGLTIARRISRLLGGELSAASEAGHGATFTLWLPVERRVTDRRKGDKGGAMQHAEA